MARLRGHLHRAVGVPAFGATGDNVKEYSVFIFGAGQARIPSAFGCVRIRSGGRQDHLVEA